MTTSCRPTSELPPTCDVLVVGAGVVGATVAYEMSRRGLSVTVVDAGTDVGHGCSYANAGLLSPEHVEVTATPAGVREGLSRFGSAESPLRVRPRASMVPALAALTWSSRPRRSGLVSRRMQELAHASLRMHLALPEQGVDTGVRQIGSMDVFTPRAGSVDHPHGPTITDVREVEPQIRHGHSAIRYPHHAMLESHTYVRALLDAAARHGARIVWEAAVTGVETHDDRVTAVSTTAGEISPGHVVLAAGLGSSRVAGLIGVRLPMLGGRGYVIDLAPVEGRRLHGPVVFLDRRVVATPYADRLRLCGTLELGSDDLGPDPRRFDAVLAAGRTELGAAVSDEIIDRWSGLRPCTTDGAPVIGRSGLVPQLLVAAGHGMWGLMLAPVTARLLADGLVDGAPTLHDPCFTPDRFGRTGAR